MSVKEKLPFPRMLDIELTNRCNFRCVMCPTGQKTVKRQTGDMSFELYLQILEEAVRWNSPIRFIRWGEPMLYDKLTDAIIEAKTLDIICHINTNGSIIDDDWNDFFVKVGLDSIKFSFQGVSKTGYEHMRNSTKFHKLVHNIKKLHDLREYYQADAPFIQVGTTITNESESAVKQFLAMLDNCTDAVYVGTTRDLQVPSRTDQFCECPEVFDKLSINWDGSVSACCGDYDNFTIIGNLNEQTLEEIWNGEPLAKMRAMLLDYRHYENHLCARCARSLE
jgi:radical SAM protein with 4Fe4S-binding SPASM domain